MLPSHEARLFLLPIMILFIPSCHQVCGLWSGITWFKGQYFVYNCVFFGEILQNVLWSLGYHIPLVLLRHFWNLTAASGILAISNTVSTESSMVIWCLQTYLPNFMCKRRKIFCKFTSSKDFIAGLCPFSVDVYYFICFLQYRLLSFVDEWLLFWP